VVRSLAIIITKPEIAFSNQRAQVNELLYSLGSDAKKNEVVERLLLERDQEIEAAYEFSYGVAMLDPIDRWYSSDTFNIVSEIIALKERYAKRIRRCKVRHERFNSIVKGLPSEDAETFIRAFCTDLEVDERDVKAIIRKHYKFLASFYD
jgi:hypothetical protein